MSTKLVNLLMLFPSVCELFKSRQYSEFSRFWVGCRRRKCQGLPDCFATAKYQARSLFLVVDLFAIATKPLFKVWSVQLLTYFCIYSIAFLTASASRYLFLIPSLCFSGCAYQHLAKWCRLLKHVSRWRISAALTHEEYLPRARLWMILFPFPPRSSVHKRSLCRSSSKMN